jgi:hypothetical protein
MKELFVSLGDAPGDDTSVKVQFLRDCNLEAFAEQSLQRVDISVLASQLPTALVPIELAAFVPSLAVGASISICVLEASQACNLQPIHTAFLLAGLKETSESRRADGSLTFTATKKSSTSASNAVRLHKIMNNFAASGNSDEIDEDELLQQANVLQPPPAMSSIKTKSDDDCGGRAPCENCSCGRAGPKSSDGSEEKKEGHSFDKSDCGKCSMGDAFRCASCPHLGKPAWKAGEEHLVLSLDLQDDF